MHNVIINIILQGLADSVQKLQYASTHLDANTANHPLMEFVHQTRQSKHPMIAMIRGSHRPNK